ncbi:unnamed protein product, partial [Rodentolepis nana]|uniref:Secreted protein n=1 Tax=Rodentolepis nana TaxID=102285 RepID=A0A0R3TU59_RODNA
NSLFFQLFPIVVRIPPICSISYFSVTVAVHNDNRHHFPISFLIFFAAFICRSHFVVHLFLNLGHVSNMSSFHVCPPPPPLSLYAYEFKVTNINKRI